MNIGPLLSRPSLRGIEARAGLEAFASHLCSALGLPPVTIRWTPGMTTAAINQHGDMLLADLGDASTVTRATLSRYAGFVLHELLHRKWSDFKAQDARPFVASLHNALEDAWIERKAIASGLTGNAEGLLHALIRQMIAESMAQVQDWAAPSVLPFSLAIFCRGYGVNVPTPAEVLPIWREAASRVDACASSHDTLALARWVFDQLQQQQQQQEQEEEGKPCEDGEPGKDGQPGQGEEDQQEGQQQGQEPGTEEGGQEGQETAQDGPEVEGQGEGKGEPADAGPISGTVAERTIAMEVEPTLERDDAAPGGSYTSTSVLDAGPVDTYGEEYWGSGVTVPPALRYQVRRLFENSAKEWREGGFKSGTLHRASLPQVLTGKREVFARRLSEDGVDSAVVIMLDISGSMYPTMAPIFKGHTDHAKGTRIDVAVGACIALLDTLAQAQADTMVLAFGEDQHIVKPFGMQWRKAAATLRRIAMQGDTNDFQATRYATECLMRHPAERKVLIVLTDGQGNFWETQAQAQAARDLGIRVIGIGIQTDCKGTWGKDAVTIDRVADLGAVAFGTMKAAA
jgi:cobaltochelatase CobT